MSNSNVIDLKPHLKKRKSTKIPTYSEAPEHKWYELLKLKQSSLKEPVHEKQIKEMRGYLLLFGLLQAILIDEDGAICGGNNRITALRNIKPHKPYIVPVFLLPGMSSSQKIACCLAYDQLGGNHE